MEAVMQGGGVGIPARTKAERDRKRRWHITPCAPQYRSCLYSAALIDKAKHD